MPAHRVLLPLLTLGLLPLAAVADQPLAPPEGDIILTVSGLDPAMAPDGVLAFDRAGLAALGPVSFSTTSIWTEGRHAFTGIPLWTLAQKLNLPPDAKVTLRAMNDYQVDIPLTETTPQAPLLAYEMDGKPMSVRDKGPIWVVYPYDADPRAFQTVTVFARSIWQLDRIEIPR
ncbi:molybdopterin-dependent oxidoreductase [Rhodobacter sp. KR11]|uniref:molybdopterin-dependent oxidoreductase n=1 Tax=Rhodobacter sp. KR11 TaxID=2974588 RepID=UPI00222308E5|nr:molybdopterin-dependent oxidoreductase [Rhodobacter sp. KR11]MCW1918737.1 molybdopterin-dependent oxidoreductase [Rhodobacter sp. KR11]